MLKFNSFRAKRYLRSKFVEGKYLLASEASDLELEILDVLRKVVKNTIGDVAMSDAWQVERLSQTQILIKPGEAWFKGLPFEMRSGKDQLVSGAVLSAGIMPVGVTLSDDSTGLGKIITFNDGSTTPTDLYRLVVSASEELITESTPRGGDAFLQNVNLTESTAQKIRLNFQLNLVVDADQTESPIPYTDENSVSSNLVNQIVVTPTANQNGELIQLNYIAGAEKIDGRDLELVLTNVIAGGTLPDASISTGEPIPRSLAEQQAFYNGTLIDSYGNSYHVNLITSANISTQITIRIDKELDQPDPQIVNGLPYTLIKREVFVADDTNGSPQGKLYWPIATLDWNSTNGIIHQFKIVDLRTSVTKLEDFEIFVNNKEGLRLADGGNLNWILSSQLVSWSSDLTLVNPHGTNMTIASATVPMVEGGTLVYDLNLETGGAISKGTEALVVSAFGATSTLSSGILTDVKIGNIVKDFAGVVAEITAIDEVNGTISTSPSLTANGAATVYLDSFGPSKAPLSEKTYILAIRKSNKIFVGFDDTGLSDGETTQVGQGISNQLLTFIGATGDADSSPTYTTTHYVVNGTSLVAAISALDAEAFTLANGKANIALDNLASVNINTSAFTFATGVAPTISTAGNTSTQNLIISSGASSAGTTGTSFYGTGTATGGSSGNLTVRSGNATSFTSGTSFFGSGAGTTAASGTVTVRSGVTTGNFASGSTTITTGTVAGTQPSGTNTVGSGATATGATGGTGATNLISGSTIATTSGTTGDISVRSGHNAGTGNSGMANFGTGSSVTGTTGSTGIYTGNATAGTAGAISIAPGSSGSGTGASISISSGSTVSGSNSGPTTISTANATGAGNSGDINLTTGGVAGGSRGKVLVTASSLDMNSNKIVNLLDPTANQDAASKIYVDTRTPLTTKGDVATYSTTFDRLPVGSNGQVLTADSTQTTGLKWNSVNTGATNTQDVTASGNFTVPAGVTQISILAAGGGGGGGSGTTFTNSIGNEGGAGGSGAEPRLVIVPTTPGEVLAIVIGTGGAGGAGISSTPNSTLGNAGSAGTNTTVTGAAFAVTFLGASGGSGGNFSATTDNMALSYYVPQGPRVIGGGGGASAIGQDGGSGGQTAYGTHYASGGTGGSGTSTSGNAGGASGGGGGGAGFASGANGSAGGVPSSSAGSSAAANSSAGGGGSGGGNVNGGNASTGNGGTGGSGLVRFMWVS